MRRARDAGWTNRKKRNWAQKYVECLAETEAPVERHSCGRIDVCLTTWPLTWVSAAVCDFQSKADSCALSFLVWALAVACAWLAKCVRVCGCVSCFSCCPHLLCFWLLDFWGSFGCLVSRVFGFSALSLSLAAAATCCPISREGTAQCCLIFCAACTSNVMLVTAVAPRRTWLPRNK